MTPLPDRILSGVFPIVPTPFDADGRPDEADLRRAVDFIVRAGADGLVFPGVASEFDTLSGDERARLADVVAEAVDGRVPWIVGGSSGDAATSAAIAARGRRLGAAAVMAMNPPGLKDDAAAIEAFYRAVADEGLPVVLQNAPAPVGSGLAVERIAELVDRVPGVRYVKEETMPCGQRISRLLALRPRNLAAVFGGAGGRYVTDELARGASGTMPACELTDVHALLWRLHLAGDAAGVRRVFDRMLPLLNFQAVFRMAMTKEVLRRRGVIASTGVRAAGPRLDDGDMAELSAMLEGMSELLSAVPVRG